MSNYPSEYGLFDEPGPIPCQCPLCLREAYDLHDHIDCERCGRVVYEEDTELYFQEIEDAGDE